MWKGLVLLLPALLPSWRFFAWVAPSPRVEFALLDAPGAEPFWCEFRPRPAQLGPASLLGRLFWNPRWNETLFLVACAERLLERPSEHGIAEIRDRIASDLGAWQGWLRFRLVLVHREGERLVRRTEYESVAFPLGTVR